VSLGLVTVRLKDFRRFVDETVRFRPGVNFLEGVNNAGKSTVFYAVEYALFGRAGSLGPRALMRAGTRQMGVELVFVGRDGRTYRLQRMHARPPRSRSTVKGHFTLKVRAADDDSETYLLSSDFDDLETHLALALQEALGVSKRAWDLAVHLAQGRIPQILDGSTELDIVLGVTASVVVEEELRAMALERDKAARDLPRLDERLARVTDELARQALRVQELATERASHDTALAEVEAEHAQLAARRAAPSPLERLVAALRGAASRQERAATRVAIATQALDDHAGAGVLQAQLADAEGRRSQAEVALASARAQLPETRALLRELERRRGDLQGQLARRRALGEGRCEHCGQPVDAAHLAAEVASLTADQVTLQLELVEAEARVTAAQKAERGAMTAAAEATTAARLAERALAERSRAEGAVREAEQEVAVAEAAMAAASTAAGRPLVEVEAELDAARGSLGAAEANLAARRDTVLGVVRRLEREQDEVRRTVQHLERDRSEAAAQADALRHDAEVGERLRALGKAFKGVQQHLREAATVTMAERALALHRALSGDGTELSELRLDPKRYTVEVTPADIGAPVPASLYQGGGHRLLLGLATRLALAEQLGPVPCILLDEPTYVLDEARRRALLDRIHELDVASQLIVITHHDIGDARGHVVRVVRDGDTSRFEETP
jgi:DNA repair exonuclease SbcCD ATPase subunit